MTNDNHLEVVYVLFSIHHRRFDPALVGVFTTEHEARKAEANLVKHPAHTTAFVLELPLCRSKENYIDQFKATLAKKMIHSITKKDK